MRKKSMRVHVAKNHVCARALFFSSIACKKSCYRCYLVTFANFWRPDAIFLVTGW